MRIVGIIFMRKYLEKSPFWILRRKLQNNLKVGP
jgi:hypothetical protein